jgi:hypothetical protein
MTQTFGNHDKVKMALSGFGLVFALYVYFDFVWGMIDIYPDMIWDEVVTGLLGIGAVFVWCRYLGRR